MNCLPHFFSKLEKILLELKRNTGQAGYNVGNYWGKADGEEDRRQMSQLSSEGRFISPSSAVGSVQDISRLDSTSHKTKAICSFCCCCFDFSRKGFSV